MSYDTMDHVGWVEEEVAAVKKIRMTAADQRLKLEGQGWFAAPDKLNPFQQKVITILGITGRGIYNAPVVWSSVVWRHPWLMILSWRQSMASFDFDQLTTMLFLAHDARIRLEVAPKMRHLELHFHKREPRAAGDRTFVGHPSLEQAVAAHRARFPLTHPVHYAPAAAGQEVLTP
ncbi:hypothetical protein ACLBXM_17790 [Xanthobacteraceae bacterium A53D]